MHAVFQTEKVATCQAYGCPKKSSNRVTVCNKNINYNDSLRNMFITASYNQNYHCFHLIKNYCNCIHQQNTVLKEYCS